MLEADSCRTPLIEWGVAMRSLAGQTSSGDRCLVAPLPNGVLIAVIDGLGHGDEAAAVADMAVAALRRYAGEPVTRLLRQCHEALQETRGVVMSLAWLNAENNTLSWA